MIHKISVCLTCLACMGRGKRLQTSSKGSHSTNFSRSVEPLDPEAYATSSLNPSKAFAMLLITGKPSAAFEPYIQRFASLEQRHALASWLPSKLPASLKKETMQFGRHSLEPRNSYSGLHKSMQSNDRGAAPIVMGVRRDRTRKRKVSTATKDEANRDEDDALLPEPTQNLQDVKLKTRKPEAVEDPDSPSLEAIQAIIEKRGGPMGIPEREQATEFRVPERVPEAKPSGESLPETFGAVASGRTISSATGSTTYDGLINDEPGCEKVWAMKSLDAFRKWRVGARYKPPTLEEVMTKAVEALIVNGTKDFSNSTTSSPPGLYEFYQVNRDQIDARFMWKLKKVSKRYNNLAKTKALTKLRANRPPLQKYKWFIEYYDKLDDGSELTPFDKDWINRAIDFGWSESDEEKAEDYNFIYERFEIFERVFQGRKRFGDPVPRAEQSLGGVLTQVMQGIKVDQEDLRMAAGKNPRQVWTFFTVLAAAIAAWEEKVETDYTGTSMQKLEELNELGTLLWNNQALMDEAGISPLQHILTQPKMEYQIWDAMAIEHRVAILGRRERRKRKTMFNFFCVLEQCPELEPEWYDKCREEEFEKAVDTAKAEADNERITNLFNRLEPDPEKQLLILRRLGCMAHFIRDEYDPKSYGPLYRKAIVLYDVLMKGRLELYDNWTPTLEKKPYITLWNGYRFYDADYYGERLRRFRSRREDLRQFDRVGYWKVPLAASFSQFWDELIPWRRWRQDDLRACSEYYLFDEKSDDQSGRWRFIWVGPDWERKLLLRWSMQEDKEDGLVDPSWFEEREL